MLRSGQHAVFLYSLAQGKAFQVTDGMSDALYPVFDRNGKYLYFTASTDVGLTAQGLDMSSNEHPVYAQRVRGGAEQERSVADRAAER